MKALSVVVVTRNRARRLRSLLESLRRQSADLNGFEIVIVDDGSSDSTFETLAEAQSHPQPATRVITVSGHPGLAALRNRGWRAAVAPLIAFIDDDCEAHPEWVAALLASAAATSGAVVQGRTAPIERELDLEGPLSRTKRIESAGPWFQTCNIAYPQDLLVALDGFDESFTVAGEDTDLGWRAIEAGAPIAYAPSAIAYHAVEGIGPGGWMRIAARERILSRLFVLHPGLRGQVATAGIFKDRQKALFALAVLAAAAGGRTRWALLAALPYGHLLAARCKATNVGPEWMPWFAAYDAVATAQSVRGAIESRSWMI